MLRIYDLFCNMHEIQSTVEAKQSNILPNTWNIVHLSYKQPQDLDSPNAGVDWIYRDTGEFPGGANGLAGLAVELLCYFKAAPRCS